MRGNNFGWSYQEFDQTGRPLHHPYQHRGQGPRPWRYHPEGRYNPDHSYQYHEPPVQPRIFHGNYDQSRSFDQSRSYLSDIRCDFPYPTTPKEREEAHRICKTFLHDLNRSLGPDGVTRVVEEYRREILPAGGAASRVQTAGRDEEVGDTRSEDHAEHTPPGDAGQVNNPQSAQVEGDNPENGPNDGADQVNDNQTGVPIINVGGGQPVPVVEQDTAEDTDLIQLADVNQDGQVGNNPHPQTVAEVEHHIQPRDNQYARQEQTDQNHHEQVRTGPTQGNSGRSRHYRDSEKADAIATTEAFMRPDWFVLQGRGLTTLQEELRDKAELYVPHVFKDHEDVKTAVEKRLKDIEKEGLRLIPDKLVGWKFKHFENIREYDRYVEDIYRVLAINRLMLGDYTRNPNSIPVWAREREKVTSRSEDIEPRDVITPEQPNHDLQSGCEQGRGKPKQVSYSLNPKSSEAVGTEGNETYYIQRARGGTSNDICSTPHCQKESPDVSMCSHIDPEDEARYDAYGIPSQYRRRGELATNSNNVNKPLLSSTLGGQPEQSGGQQTQGNGNSLTQGSGMTLPTQQSLMAVIPPGHILDMFTPFDGNESKYMEWKSMTQTLMRNIEADMQAILLKKLLRDPELVLVGHIYHSDPTAVSDIWKVLDKQFGGTYEQAEIYMTKLQNWARNGAQCYDYKSLLHLYSLVQENYYGIVRLGAEHIGMAEAIGYAITPLLFGKSQREVNRLRYEGRNSFTMKKVLDIIDKHLQDLKRTERDADKLTSNDPEELHKSYSERDLPFLRHGLYRDTYKDKGGYKGKNYDPNYNRYKKDHDKDYYKDRKYGYDNRKYNRDASRDRYKDRDGSRDRYSRYDRDSSTDRYKEGKYRDSSRDRYKDSKYTRELSRDRYSKYDKDSHRDSRYSSRDERSKYDRDSSREHGKYDRDTSRERYKSYRDSSRGRYRDISGDRYKDKDRDNSRDRGRSPVRVYTVNTSTEGRRGRDATPGPNGRLSTGRSPSRQRRERPYNTYKCTFCLLDDHDVFDCKKYTAEQIYTMCNERKYCYVCYLTGHGAANCKSDRDCKDSTRCRTDVKHQRLLCGKFARA